MLDVDPARRRITAYAHGDADIFDGGAFAHPAAEWLAFDDVADIFADLD